MFLAVIRGECLAIAADSKNVLSIWLAIPTSFDGREWPSYEPGLQLMSFSSRYVLGASIAKGCPAYFAQSAKVAGSSSPQ